MESNNNQIEMEDLNVEKFNTKDYKEEFRKVNDLINEIGISEKLDPRHKDRLIHPYFVEVLKIRVEREQTGRLSDDQIDRIVEIYEDSKKVKEKYGSS